MIQDINFINTTKYTLGIYSMILQEEIKLKLTFSKYKI